MKAPIFWTSSIGLVLAVLSLSGGSGQETANSTPAPAPATQEVVTNSTGITDADSPEVAEQKLENAPAQIVSAPKAPPSGVNLSATAGEIVRLAQAGLDESVMLAFVTNSTYVFKLSSDDIIYLNDVGVPSTVVTAMLRHDQNVNTMALTPPVYSNQPPANAPVPYPTTEPTEVQAPMTAAVDTAPPAANVSSTYFYDSLAPYGTWIDVAGYGRCWQPTVVVANRGWQPYCDRGRWVYSDCGWYWASDYSWGWAPFHYGRWFNHGSFGWCWAPDTVWGPSWVNWRYTSGYCGWAPLPPTACYTPGFGFSYCGLSVGIGFSFGLSAGCYTFVPTSRFCDPHPGVHRLRAHNVSQIFNNTVVVNDVVERDRHRLVNRGIPVDQVAAATRRDIRPVEIQRTDDFASVRRGGGRIDRTGSTLTVYHPELPAPTRRGSLVGEGVQAPPRDRHDLHIGVVPAEASRRGDRSVRGSANPVARDPLANTPPVVRNDSPRQNQPGADDSAAVPSPSPRSGRSPNFRTQDRPVNPANVGNGAAPRPRNIPTASANPGPTMNQPAATVPQPDPAPIIIRNPNRPSANGSAPQAPAASPRMNPYSWQNNNSGNNNSGNNVRQEPRFRQQNQVESAPPSMPVQRQPSTPNYQAPRAPEPRSWTPPSAPAPQSQRSMPSYRSEPAAPRFEMPRSAPAPSAAPQQRSSPPPQAAPAAPAPQRSAPPASNNSRQDQGDSNNRHRSR